MKNLRIALAGLGRMGHRHALHLLESTPRAELVAACSVDKEDLDWGKQNLEPHGVKVFDNYDDMLDYPGIEAVLIATTTVHHASEAIKAIQRGMHVLSEKPLSTNLEDAQKVIDTAEKHPLLKVMTGFSRRFDASYRDAKKKLDAGVIGDAFLVRSHTCDKYDPNGFFVKYAAASGGIWVDCAIHDIDLTLFYLGDIVPKTCWATGVNACHPELKESSDCDNAIGIVEFEGGKIAQYYCSRTMIHGHDVATEVIGTKGKLAINIHPQMTKVEIGDCHGLRNEVENDYYDRFHDAFITEVNEFTAAVLDDLPVPIALKLHLVSLKIALALQESLVTGTKIEFN